MFPYNENPAQFLMKRMKSIDWIDTNTNSQAVTHVFRLTNWTGTIDFPSAGDSGRLFLVFPFNK